MKNWFTIKAAAPGSDTREVSILSEIGYWGVNAQQFLTEFRAISEPNVKLFINSPGGSVFEALAIFNGMRATGKNIEVHILGIAASAASYIAMCGHKIVMPANTMMFVHNPINAVYGNAEDMREMADILDKIGASLTATYAKRWKGDEKLLADVLAAESYLTAAECLEYGFCDEVTDEITATALFEVDKLPANVQALFKAKAVPDTSPSVPFAEQVKALAKAHGLESLAAVFVTDPTVTTIAAAETLIAAATEIQALAKVAGLPERAEALIRARKTVTETRAALASELAEADAALQVDTAVKSKTLQSPRDDSGWSPSAQWAEIHAMKAGSKK